MITSANLETSSSRLVLKDQRDQRSRNTIVPSLTSTPTDHITPGNMPDCQRALQPKRTSTNTSRISSSSCSNDRCSKTHKCSWTNSTSLLDTWP